MSKDYIETEGFLIIMLEVPVKMRFNKNVFGIDLKEKNVKWQVKKIKHNSKNCPYIGLTLIEKNKVCLSNWCSKYVVVDPTSGNIIEIGEAR